MLGPVTQNFCADERADPEKGRVKASTPYQTRKASVLWLHQVLSSPATDSKARVASLCSPLQAWKQGHLTPREGILGWKQEQGEKDVPRNWDPLLPEGPEASRTEETGLSKGKREPSLSAPAPPWAPWEN